LPSLATWDSQNSLMAVYVGYALSFWFDAAFPDCYLRFKKAQKWAFLNFVNTRWLFLLFGDHFFDHANHGH
jgi:hypothetical protein